MGKEEENSYDGIKKNIQLYTSTYQAAQRSMQPSVGEEKYRIQKHCDENRKQESNKGQMRRETYFTKFIKKSLTRV